MNLKELINFYSNKLEDVYKDIEVSRRYIKILLEKILNKKISIIDNFFVEEVEIKKLENYIEKIILENFPIQYILEEITFLNVDINVKSPILIPRSETEFWLNEVFLNLKNKLTNNLEIADLGSGTGCIGIAFCKEFLNAKCIAVDIDLNACILSEKNALKNNVQDRYKIFNLDMELFLKEDNKYFFDIIFSNPPYISVNDYNSLGKDVKNWESRIALTDLEDGKKYIKILLKNAYKKLKKNGILAVEFDSNNFKQIKELICKYDKYYKNCIFIIDQYGKNRAFVLEKV